MKKLFTHIKTLAGAREEAPLLRGNDLQVLPVIENAFLLVIDGRIHSYGAMDALHAVEFILDAKRISCEGKCVLPTWVDSHTHLVFAGSREDEFVSKLKGKTYAEIAAAGGGILNSAKRLHNASEEELLGDALRRLQVLIRLGTGAIEIKSGYGLSVEAELKMLRVIKKIKAISPIPVKATFLGAHSYPEMYKENHEPYLKQLIEEMLPAIAEENLADYIDVFCESGFFSAAETDRICKAGAQYGLQPKLHINQLNSIGGVEVGIANDAVSLDHVETLTDKEIQLLGGYKGCTTLLPTAAFFLRMDYQPARKLIDAGAAVTLASDYNPGSSPSGNMNFVAALSCIQMKMLPEEVINAGTVNGAYAMGLEKEVGSISKGKRANFIVTDEINSLPFLFYSFGTNLIHEVYINGEAASSITVSP